MWRRIFKVKKRRAERLYVVEAALLPDVGKELCDELWYIYADESVRRERLKASRGYTDEKISQMIASRLRKNGSVQPAAW